MSAFQVSTGHIDRLVAVALYGPKDAGGYRWTRLTWWSRDPRTAQRECTNYDDYLRRLDAIRRGVAVETCDAVGEMLTRANLHSINARYPRHRRQSRRHSRCGDLGIRAVPIPGRHARCHCATSLTARGAARAQLLRIPELRG